MSFINTNQGCQNGLELELSSCCLRNDNSNSGQRHVKIRRGVSHATPGHLQSNTATPFQRHRNYFGIGIGRIVILKFSVNPSNSGRMELAELQSCANPKTFFGSHATPFQSFEFENFPTPRHSNSNVEWNCSPIPIPVRQTQATPFHATPESSNSPIPVEWRGIGVGLQFL